MRLRFSSQFSCLERGTHGTKEALIVGNKARRREKSDNEAGTTTCLETFRIGNRFERVVAASGERRRRAPIGGCVVHARLAPHPAVCLHSRQSCASDCIFGHAGHLPVANRSQKPRKAAGAFSQNCYLHGSPAAACNREPTNGQAR